MILALICYSLLIALFAGIAFTISAIWVKIVCWIVVAILLGTIAFAFFISQTYGKIGRGGG